MRIRITEYLDADLETEHWHCNCCSSDLGPLNRPYKEGCLVQERDPRDVHFPIGGDKEYNFSFDRRAGRHCALGTRAALHERRTRRRRPQGLAADSLG